MLVANADTDGLAGERLRVATAVPVVAAGIAATIAPALALPRRREREPRPDATPLAEHAS